MTEQELIDLRDSLVGINSSLDGLDSRVTALESNASPKGTYFNQLKASFEGSPECCECGTTQGCECATSENTAYFLSDSDGLTFSGASFEINGVVVTNETWPSALEIGGNAVYVFDSSNTYLHTLYVGSIRNMGSTPLCIKITNERDIYSNPAMPLLPLVLPIEGDEAGTQYRTAYNYAESAEFAYTINPTIVNNDPTNEDINEATLCLGAFA